MLKEIAESGRTVICSIHQPRSDVVPLFDQCLLLARGGHVVYSGPSNLMLAYFESTGYVCDSNSNPADFVLNLSSVDLRNIELETETRRRVEFLKTRWTEKAIDGSIEVDRQIDLSRSFCKPKPFYIAVPILVRRSIKNLFRQIELVLVRVWQVAALGGILAMFFATIKDDQVYIQSRIGLMQQV